MTARWPTLSCRHQTKQSAAAARRLPLERSLAPTRPREQARRTKRGHHELTSSAARRFAPDRAPSRATSACRALARPAVVPERSGSRAARRAGSGWNRHRRACGMIPATCGTRVLRRPHFDAVAAMIGLWPGQYPRIASALSSTFARRVRRTASPVASPPPWASSPTTTSFRTSRRRAKRPCSSGSRQASQHRCGRHHRAKVDQGFARAGSWVPPCPCLFAGQPLLASHCRATLMCAFPQRPEQRCRLALRVRRVAREYIIARSGHCIRPR